MGWKRWLERWEVRSYGDWNEFTKTAKGMFFDAIQTHIYKAKIQKRDLAERMNEKKQEITNPDEKRSFLKEFITVSTSIIIELKATFYSKNLLENRVRFKHAGREILKNKLSKIDKMNNQELENLHVYFRDVFLCKYLPSTTKPSPKINKYNPVIKICTR